LKKTTTYVCLDCGGNEIAYQKVHINSNKHQISNSYSIPEIIGYEYKCACGGSMAPVVPCGTKRGPIDITDGIIKHD